ncbi:hypothetical protein DIPPA_32277 [Diplonema papillatum]|nr:hypothetical protein DIPPA_32277 [Diplonema papillatum]
MYHCGESYTGSCTADGKRMHKEGELTFSNGNQYKGSFDDGRFHGEGVIHFTQQSGGGQFRASWEFGKEKSGDYIFSDGLQYAPTQWQYCTPDDRRLWNEHLTFIAPPRPEGANDEDVILPDYSGEEESSTTLKGRLS